MRAHKGRFGVPVDRSGPHCHRDTPHLSLDGTNGRESVIAARPAKRCLIVRGTSFHYCSSCPCPGAIHSAAVTTCTDEDAAQNTQIFFQATFRRRAIHSRCWEGTRWEDFLELVPYWETVVGITSFKNERTKEINELFFLRHENENHSSIKLYTKINFNIVFNDIK